MWLFSVGLVLRPMKIQAFCVEFVWSHHTVSTWNKLINCIPSSVTSAMYFIGTSETLCRIWKSLDEMLWLATLGHKQWRCLIFVTSPYTSSALLHPLWISLFLAKLFYPPQVLSVCCFFPSISRWVSFFLFAWGGGKKGANCFLDFWISMIIMNNCNIPEDGVGTKGPLQ